MTKKESEQMIFIKVAFRDNNSNKKIILSGEASVKNLCTPSEEWIVVNNRMYDGQQWIFIENIVHKADVIDVEVFEVKHHLSFDSENLSLNAIIDTYVMA